MKYGKGSVILNWERNENELRVHDPVDENHHIGIVGKGKIPMDTFVHVSWILDQDYMLLLVDGEKRLNGTMAITATTRWPYSFRTESM